MNVLPSAAEMLRAQATPVIVTGAGGWLGRAALDMLDNALGPALPARVTAFASTAKAIRLVSGRLVVARAFSGLLDYPVKSPLVFHFAFLTREFARMMPPAEYLKINRAISAAMLEFLNRAGAAGLVLPSSGAARDPDFGRNPYGALKQEDEFAFAAMASRLGCPAAIVRIFNLAGPYINKTEDYALACIIADLRRNAPVKLRAAHPVWRSYTHVEDVLNIALSIVQKQLSLPVFDTAGAEPIEIRALAARAAGLLTGKPVNIHRPAWRDGIEDRYLGDLASYQHAASLAQVKLQSLDKQIVDTAAYMDNETKPI